MKPDTYREHLTDLQVEVEELRAQLKEAQTGDLISRQAAIDSIEKHLRSGDELYPLTDTDKILNYAFEVAASCVYNLPSAQPEIIKCKGCKHYEADIMGNPWGVCCHQDWITDNCGSLVDQNGWCYRAERRSDE